MKAQYLLRFEDVCPTMNWRVWDRVESILYKRNIQPILAVIPDNQDPDLQVAPADPNFWGRVRGWQTRNWTIAVHGWQHRFVTTNPGIVRLSNRSEFAGLPEAEQERKIQCALNVFDRENIESSLWIAPAHSFDATTLKTVKKLGFRYISDGLSVYPHTDEFGLTWIPQQLWAFRQRPFGTWTIAFHINTWSNADLVAFEANTEKYSHLMSNFEQIVGKYCVGRSTAWQSAASSAYRAAARVRVSL
jgi:predicted deacetylase